jgi:hypothetical protein
LLSELKLTDTNRCARPVKFFATLFFDLCGVPGDFRQALDLNMNPESRPRVSTYAMLQTPAAATFWQARANIHSR